MSVFDTNSLHPIEELYDQCKEIVEEIVPGHIMHYNANIDTLQRVVIVALKERGIWAYPTFNVHENINNISRVEVCKGGYQYRIPTFIVYFYYVKEIQNNVNAQAYLTHFTVGINGIINEHIQ